MTTTKDAGSLVDTDWLATHLDAADLVILDASWYLPDSGRDPLTEHHAGHIPGAVFYDVDAHSDTRSDLPHMLPSPRRFQASLLMLGIEPEDLVVVYDGSGTNLSAPRVWWTFKVMGFERVAVLDGGLQKWRAEGRPLDTGFESPRPARDSFVPTAPSSRMRGLEEVRCLVQSRDEQIVDARSLGRFSAEEPEPRAGLRGGHIPHSRHLHYRSIHAEDGTLLPPAQLRNLFAGAGLDLGRPIVATCGSGMSACALLLALDRLGVEDTSLYDGSWAEYGATEDPVEQGRPAPTESREPGSEA
jgi:thiosulfate/3-mercaptopyruvate sulfurtransferase